MLSRRLLAVVLAMAAACSRAMPPDRKESLLEQGDQALTAGNLADAQRAFEEVAVADPNNARAVFGMGLAMVRQGQTARALPLFEKAMALDPGNPDHAYLRAHTLAALGRRDEALEAYGKLTDAHPDRTQAILEQLTLLIDANRLGDAEKTALAALERSPRQFELLVATGRIHGLAGLHRESIAYYERARHVRPYAAQPVYGLVEAYRHTGDTQKSLSLIKEFEQIQTRDADLKKLQDEAARTPDDPQPALRYLDRLLEEKRNDEAVEIAAGILSRFPELPERGRLALRVARVAAEAGSPDAAHGLLQAAESSGRQTPEDMLALAGVHEKLGEFTEALALYDRCLQDRPNDPKALLGMGRAAMASGQVDLAEAPLRRASALMPKDAEAHAMRGLLLLKKGDVPGGEAELKAGLQLDPGQPDALFGLGFLAHQGRDNEKAESYLRRAVAGRPDYGSALVVLALVLSERGRCDEAIPIFTSALEWEYRNMTLHAGLVRCLEQTGRTAEAANARRIAEQVAGKAPGPGSPESPPDPADKVDKK